jgi:transposase
MRLPTFVRPLRRHERERLEAGLRSTAAFELRRCQILLASARGERAPAIASAVGCSSQTVHNVLRAFHARGLASLTKRSSRPRTVRPAFGAGGADALRALLHQSPRAFGHARSTWTLTLLAQVAHEQGLSATVLSDETIRRALARLEVGWKRAKRWLTSPDPDYARKKVAATA